MKKLFGTDGIRGLAESFPLDSDTVSTIGASLAGQFRERLGRQPRFVIGMDTRESGSRIENAFHAGAVKGKAECESAGVITTPGVAFLTKHFEFDAGIVISASHNPFQDNGIKIFSPDGKKIGDATERAIEKDIFEKREEGEPAATNINSSRREEFENAYLDSLTTGFRDLSLNGLKIVADCANGAASHLAPKLFGNLGADLTVIHCSPDGRNINRDCGSLHLEHLQSKVLEENADFGVAFDGDADRALFVNEKGNIVDGDATLWIMAQYLQRHNKLVNRTVVATVMSNIGLELALASIDLKLVRAAVGDKYVLEELLKTGSEIGGEQSGHIIIPEKSLVGDGLMTTLFLLKAIRERGLAFSEMAAGFVRYPQVLVNVKVSEKRPFAEVREIEAATRVIESELDGKGRLLLRYSGTENLARVMIEGENQDAIESQAHRLAEVIRSALPTLL
ncbi:MAG: phosphoglucosamine mutase [Saprospiraceae bacterium]|nr:phosphoglucosamine mutase [Pyrinomonadaceae bacterium]